MKTDFLHRPQPNEKIARFAYAQTKWLLFLFQFLAIFLVYLFQVKELSERSLLFGGGLLLVSLLSLTILHVVTKGDSYLLLIANMIFSVGIIMIYRLDPARGEKQLMIYLASLVAFFVVTVILRHTPTLWEGHTLFYFVVTLMLFLVTLAFGVT